MIDSETKNVDQPLNDESFGDILSEFEKDNRPTEDGEGPDQVQATIVSIGEEAAVLDVGRKTEGVLPLDSLRDSRGQISLKVGDKIPVSITGRTQDGYYTVSRVHVVVPKDWSALHAALEEKRTISGTVTGQVKGGFRVDIGVPAFMPASCSGVREESAMVALLNQEIECRIIQIDSEKEDVVVDRRVILEEQEGKRRQELFQSLREGEVVEGTVARLTNFGAFVDLGGVDGLLHVADMSWGRNVKPEDLVKTGDQIRVQVLKITPEKRRIALGLKQLTADPWAEAAAKYQTGQRVKGTVARLADFGAFVELEPGVEGLIHLSEMSWSKRIRKPSDVLREGESVEAVILQVNPEERRIALGLKQALGDPWDDAAQNYPVGGVVEGAVINLAQFGAFVKVTEDFEGMIHVGDITSEKRLQHPAEVLKVGQTVRAQVLEVDQPRRRLRLGMKQLEPTSGDLFMQEHQPGDTVSGRVLRAGKNRLEVELAEGVTATCPVSEVKPPPAPAEPATGQRDIRSLTDMLAARWKEGPSATISSASESPYRPGQLLNFRIVAMDVSTGKIDLELPAS